MRAIYFDSYGGPEVLGVRDVPDKTADPNRVVIRVKAASVNRSDWEAMTGTPAYVRASGNGIRRPKRSGLGSDVAGIVEEVGEGVTTFQPGDRVFGDLLWTGPATFAELANPPQTAPLAKIPDGVSFEQAAAIPQAGGLAWQGLTEAGAPTSGERILIIGAGGGAGSFAVQLAKHFEAEVTAVDNGGKLGFMRELGADHVVDYQAEDVFKKRVKYQRILDFAGKRSMFAYRRGLARGGSYRMVGGTTPRILQLLTVGSTMAVASSVSMRLVMAKPSADDLAKLAAMVERGDIHSPIDSIRSLDETPEALARLGQCAAKGKLVIAI